MTLKEIVFNQAIIYISTCIISLPHSSEEKGNLWGVLRWMHNQEFELLKCKCVWNVCRHNMLICDNVYVYVYVKANVSVKANFNHNKKSNEMKLKSN